LLGSRYVMRVEILEVCDLIARGKIWPHGFVEAQTVLNALCLRGMAGSRSSADAGADRLFRVDTPA
jgi:hypothetical protein